VTGKPVRLLDGRFGQYVADGVTNATLPKGADPIALTFDDALALLPRALSLATKKQIAKAAKAAKPRLRGIGEARQG